MNLRERLTAKARRRVVVSIPVTDPGDAARRAAEQATAQVTVARLAGAPPDRVNELQDAADVAQAVLAEHTVDIALRALPAAEWEALTARHLLDNGEDLDWDELLPVALACCVEDTDLGDVDWWRERLREAAWTAGDVAALRRAVLHVNQWQPPVYVPKG